MSEQSWSDLSANSQLDLGSKKRDSNNALDFDDAVIVTMGDESDPEHADTSRSANLDPTNLDGGENQAEDDESDLTHTSITTNWEPGGRMSQPADVSPQPSHPADSDLGLFDWATSQGVPEVKDLDAIIARLEAHLYESFDGESPSGDEVWGGLD